MKFTETYLVSAPPEVVYNTLTDPDRANRWLPSTVAAEVTGTERMTICADGHVREYQLGRSLHEMRLSWRSLDADVHGWARVREAPAGGSALDVEISLSQPGVRPDQVRGVVDEVVRHLRRDVSDNFTAG